MDSETTRIEQLLKRNLEMQQRIFQALTRIEQCLDGFTDEGASFRSQQIDPLQLAVIGMAAGVIGDRLDGALPREGNETLEQRRESLARISCLAAHDLLAIVDQYRQQRQTPAMLESLLGPPDKESR